MEMLHQPIPLQPFTSSWLPANIQAAMLRLDLLHPEISGNKWFKLKYNLEAAREAGQHTILTFGGAWSNHIVATAAACQQAGFHAIGIIRGEAPPPDQLSSTLRLAADYGMELHYISREDYRRKEQTDWHSRFPNCYIIPEGGHNGAGARGCQEILTLAPTLDFTHILCATGTGTTLAGIINSAQADQQVIGISVLKGATSLNETVASLLQPHHAPWTLLHDFHLGGYARTPPLLIQFINNFYQETQIPLDIIYTGKMMHAFRELCLQSYFPAGSRILLIHTGGLQGNLSLDPCVLSF